MRSEKGFTLLELLGVMIVLAVISLIAVPIVMDSVNESRKSTLRNSYQSLLKAIDMNKSYDTINFSKMYVVREGVLNPDVDYEGELEGDGTIVVNSKGQIKVLVQTEDWCISKEYEDSKVSIQDGECSTSADSTYPEYAYVPEIQQALIDGTRQLETDVTLALDETTSGIIYNGTSQDLILPSSIAGTPLWEYSFVSKPDGTPLPLATIYMPDGIWYDFFTGKKFPGGKNYVSFFKDQDYPVFAKTGAIIPFGNQDDLNDTTPPKNMEIHIFPGKDNQYNLYEDDGVSDLYRKGYYLLTSIEYNYLPNNYTVIIRSVEGKSGIIPERRNYKIRFRNTKQANDVIVYFNDQKIQYSAYVEGPDFIVEVENIPTIGQLTFNCKGNDIEIDAVRLINEDIAEIISDLQIETDMKERIDAILFGDLPIKKKRIAVRKLGKHGLEKRHIKLFLKLLEYVSEV